MNAPAETAPLHFPGFTPMGGSRACGKKNCLASVTMLGLPTTIHFGGSGDPDLPPAESLKPGDEVVWKYNNMIATFPFLRWIVGRLDPSQRSIARLDIRVVNGASVLTVVYVRLHLVFEIRRIGASIRLLQPLEFELESIVDENHFKFRQVAPPAALRMLGVPVMRLTSSSLDVTGPRGIQLGEMSVPGIDTPLFSAKLEPSASQVSGPLIWILHDPNNSAARLAVGRVSLNGELEVSNRDAPLFQRGTGWQLEVVSLRDSRHLWAWRVL